MALLTWNKKLNVNAKKEITRIKQELEWAKQGQGELRQQTIMMKQKELETAYKNEEIFWGQKARHKWLKEGNRNTAYFHATVTSRRRRNRMSRLEKADGG